ncbi:hypothetical protein PILCRDRAFT_10252 [Piloderma croceum F 1598]|uniref:Uncharacterized protein n=1 Tax=Piloderma croceum (strain F 1598) TaxID=765440 RepID=A0A0C3F3S4_PILCF|nr:hypothetical protein PILCRDRAFT_10252 [Piloderma croceum F 1598]
MAHTVYKTLKLYGLRGRVVAINCNNASNNDTMVDELERLHAEDGFEFKATEAQIQCIPHTVHLLALELLEFIGAVKRRMLLRVHIKTQLDDGNSDDSQDPEVILQEVLSAIEKLCKIIRAVENALTHTALMLILDVKTRWFSTHQMLRT